MKIACLCQKIVFQHLWFSKYILWLFTFEAFKSSIGKKSWSEWALSSHFYPETLFKALTCYDIWVSTTGSLGLWHFLGLKNKLCLGLFKISISNFYRQIVFASKKFVKKKKHSGYYWRNHRMCTAVLGCWGPGLTYGWKAEALN